MNQNPQNRRTQKQKTLKNTNSITDNLSKHLPKHHPRSLCFPTWSIWPRPLMCRYHHCRSPEVEDLQTCEKKGKQKRSSTKGLQRCRLLFGSPGKYLKNSQKNTFETPGIAFSCFLRGNLYKSQVFLGVLIGVVICRPLGFVEEVWSFANNQNSNGTSCR